MFTPWTKGVCRACTEDYFSIFSGFVVFQAWAVFKGKFKEGDKAEPATWKTRLRCALNKSPDFEEVTDRSQLDISEPYKVYRIVPEEEQKCECPEEGTGPGTALAGADLHLSGACGADPITWGRALCPFLGPGGGEGAAGLAGSEGGISPCLGYGE